MASAFAGWEDGVFRAHGLDEGVLLSVALGDGVFGLEPWHHFYDAGN